MTVLEVIKELADTVYQNALKYKEKFSKIDNDLDEVKGKVKKFEIDIKDFTLYDDAPLRKELEETSELLLEEVSDVKKLIVTYDDAEILKEIEVQKEASKNLYADMQEVLISLDETKTYNKNQHSETLDVIEAQKEQIKSLQDELEEVKNKEVTLTMPKLHNYNMDEVGKGTFVKYKNSLWLSLMDENDTPPSKNNYAYQLVLEAPKEIEHKGLWDKDSEYRQGNIVMFNNASWFKTSDPKQEIPSSGWKLLAKQGKQGKQGKTGEVTIQENDFGEAIQTLSDEVEILKSQVSKK